MNIRDFIETLPLNLNVTERYNCPSCGNYNTLSVTKKVGGTVWFCFHNTCKTQGKMGGTLTTDMLSHYFQNNTHITEFKPKDNWFDQSQVQKILDRQKERYVFLIWINGMCVGGTGRSYLDTPKWLVYTPNKFPLIVPKYGTYYSPYYLAGEKKVGVVVEDAISAAAVSHVSDGIALLGTHIPDHYIPILAEYDELLIALDEDATDKAVEYQQVLNVFVPTRLVMLEQDLKELDKQQIMEKLA